MIIQGDCLSVMRDMADDTFDAVITDPPYCSGGESQRGQSKPTSEKYTMAKALSKMPDFFDALTPSAWRRFTREWLTESRRISKNGAPLLIFCDWRQIGELQDIVTMSGWWIRGLLVWDKKISRNQLGRFRQDAEFIIFASKGRLPTDRACGFPTRISKGVFSIAQCQAANRNHQTEKPVALMRELVKITTPNGHILDPFCGSGSTNVAAIMEGYQCTGIEITDAYAEVAKRREAEVTSVEVHVNWT
jgi:site-specific DNA-methyltransferase (adenine-specific)